MDYVRMYFRLFLFSVPNTVSRKAYWRMALVSLVFSYLILYVDYLFGTLSPDGFGILNCILGIWMLIPGTQLGIARLRDTGRYTWKSLLWVLLPIAGVIILLWRLTRPTGEIQSIKGGPSGPSKNDWKKFQSGDELSSDWNINQSLIAK